MTGRYSMVVVTKTRQLGVAVVLSAGTLLPSLSQADQPDAHYIITTPNMPAIGYVAASSVSIAITDPSGRPPSNDDIRHLKLTLNGVDEPNALSQSGTGTLSGLRVGANTISLYETKDPNSRRPSWSQVGQLVVERATGPAVACQSLANLTGFPIQMLG